MLPDDWELRMERAALEGALSHTRTLGPFLQEMIDDARRELDATEMEMAENVRSHSSES